MIWTGFFLLGEQRAKFRMEFNPNKNEWVEFPDWLRSALEDYIEQNPQTFRTMVIPPRIITPSLETPFIDVESLDDREDLKEAGDLVLVAGMRNMSNLVETMLWLESQGVIGVIRVEQIVEPADENMQIIF